MKKNYTLLAILALSLSKVNAQQTQLKDSLCTMNKIQLTEIFIDEVQRVNGKLFVLPFKDVSGCVPDTKYTQSKFSCVDKKLEALNIVLEEKFKEIIPYSNQDDLINAIMYLKNQ